MDYKNLKILAIDDNLDNLTSLSALIHDFFPQCSMYTASNGSDGISLAKLYDPDAVLLDIVMPQMDGFDVCKILKADNILQNIPVVFLTALSSDKESRIKALEIGAEAFLTKPYNETELIAIIKAMAKIKEANVQKEKEQAKLNRLVKERTSELEKKQNETQAILNDLKSEIETRKKIEARLRESESLFRNMFEQNSSIKLLIDPDSGNIIDANQAAVNFYGWSKQKLLKMKIHEINTLPTVETHENMIKARTNEQQYFDFKHRLADGTVRDVEVFSNFYEINGKSFLQSIIRDITEKKKTEALIKLEDARLESLLRINHFKARSIQELLDYALEEAIALTNSKIGYIYFYNENKKEFTLNTWSKEVMQQCSVHMPQTVYHLDKTGIWGEAVRQAKPILINNFEAPDPLKKGLPQGHAPLHKFLTIPVFFEEHIVAVVGVANKPDDYTQSDIRQLNLMMDSVWKIVQRKISDDNILMNEARLRRAELASKTGNWELHLDTRTIVTSEGAAKIYGLQSYQLDYDIIRNFPLPEYRNKLDLALKNLIDFDQPYDLEFKIKRTDDGQIRDIHSIATFDKENRILFGVIQDVTDQKKTEQKLLEEQLFTEILIENLPGIFYLYTFPNIKLVRWNKNHETILGLTSDELKNRLFENWTHPEIKEQLIAAMHLAADIGFVQTEISFYHKNGSKIPFILTGTKLVLNDQTYIMGFGIDISDRKKAEDDLLISELRLREINATKDKFFSIIAHDLKSPFNSILGLSEMLVGQVKNKDFDGIEEYSEIIHSSSKRAMDLLLNLLEWSRSQTGRMEFNPEYIELISLINDVSELLYDQAKQKSITINSNLPQKLLAFADKAMISTILRNLLSNAIKFTHPGGQIIITAVKDKTNLKVSIADNGVGIAQANIEKLFRIEDNHSTNGTRNEKGTGLGLILCKEFVEKHNGKIWVESEPNIGSTFYFSIPNK